jgi:hypothetical protein
MRVNLRMLVLGATMALGQSACENSGEVSQNHAKVHVRMLKKTVASDVEEIRRGLPEGAQHLSLLYAADAKPSDDREAVRQALETARAKVQDLRVAKATFFALVDSDGRILRNDQEQDLMADVDALQSFPKLKEALGGAYVETRGYMAEARGVAEPIPDGQWVAAAPVRTDGTVRGAYVAGWSFSRYAYRLEFKLRGEARAALLDEKDARKNEPLIYVYLLVGEQAIGAPMSPAVNMKTLEDLRINEKCEAGPQSQVVEITGRTFGLAAERAPALGSDVAVAVLRSET